MPVEGRARRVRTMLTNTGAPLTPRQACFVAEYLITLNATQAAVKAGYSRHSGRFMASRLLTKRNIADAVAAGLEAALGDVNATLDVSPTTRPNSCGSIPCAGSTDTPANCTSTA